MTRTAAREIAVHLSFASSVNPMNISEMLEVFFDGDYYTTLSREDELYSEYPDEAQLRYIRRVALGVAEHAAELDSYIAKYSKNWRFERISRVAAAIIRVAMFELLYMPGEIPCKAAINEAVSLAKGYEEADVVRFVNGVLGGFVKGELDPSGE
ncbi:MAG: transcription antitermination factor NusB [Oscillospiraceae bacterium]|nr:transcription antitermination factor NusB [Oscillospiraceae bacterium]